MKLAGIFSNGMILQRERPCTIWGQADPQEKIRVILEEKEYEAIVEDSRFKITLPPHEACTGLRLTIEGNSSVTLEDVCFGDVFFLTGQSNMELPVYRTMDVSKEEIEASDYPYIRQYRVTPQFQMDKNIVADLPDLPWTKAVPGEVNEMSALGFFSAKRIYDQIQVPIGLVLSAQGGSNIEAWMPEELLEEFGDFSHFYKMFEGEDALPKYLKQCEEKNAKWREDLVRPEDEQMPRSIPSGASDFEVPGMLLEQNGNGFTGIIWFYKEIELQEEPSEDAFLYVGNLIDADQTFVNGVPVGRTEYRYPPRKYPFDGKILRKGKNLICVRLLIEGGNGGFVAAHPYYLRSGEEQVSLEGTWKMLLAQTPDRPLEPGVRGQNVPTALFKTSVRPLADFAFRGIWWYQGESNSDEPARYNEKFNAMISCWRKLLNQELPLICVEMPDYTDPVFGVPEGWASIQEQQRAAAKEVPDCAVVSGKDLGAPLELHPQRKSELGARLATTALQLYYKM